MSIEKIECGGCAPPVFSDTIDETRPLDPERLANSVVEIVKGWSGVYASLQFKCDMRQVFRTLTPLYPKETVEALRASNEKWRAFVSVMSEQVQSHIDKVKEANAERDAMRAEVERLLDVESSLRESLMSSRTRAEAAEARAAKFTDAMRLCGNWDDGCFYYNKVAAPELGAALNYQGQDNG